FLGRITAKRELGSKLVFYTIKNDETTVQVVSSRQSFKGTDDEFKQANRRLHIGDIAYFSGFPGMTGTGELSMFASSQSLLCLCWHDIPFKQKLRDPEKRIRHRYLDMIINDDLRTRIRLRMKITNYVRQFLLNRDFVEVETPVLSSQAGGANARPFVTKANAYDMDLSLRIAPELFLKQMVIGGLDRVFEIGKQFRNEGIDHTHNPEFTTCEFYQAYANLEHLITETEELLSGTDYSSLSSRVDSYANIDNPGVKVVSFRRPFRKINIREELENQIGKLPDLNNPASTSHLLRVLESHHIHFTGPKTLPKVIDALISHFIEPKCVDPTFLIGHPLVLSPLAKEMAENKGMAARFELFVAQKELVNAYEELNDPIEQRTRFEVQQMNRNLGDRESHPPDEDFCRALEYGLPPTGGWGLGIDRLCMLLGNTKNIKDVIVFPVVKPDRSGAIDKAH
ncbi:hypothetical protein BKA69DRAFT_1024135, partial [Paraphysoderma sedebokerense]